MSDDALPTGFSRVEIIVPESRLAAFQLLKIRMRHGDYTPLDEIDNERDQVQARALDGLRLISDAIKSNPATGQRYRLTRFLAGLYNGPEHPFDMTDLRGLDGRLARACLDVLAYDALGIREIHAWGVISQDQLMNWFHEDGVFDRAEARRVGVALYREKYGDEGHHAS